MFPIQANVPFLYPLKTLTFWFLGGREMVRGFEIGYKLFLGRKIQGTPRVRQQIR